MVGVMGEEGMWNVDGTDTAEKRRIDCVVLTARLWLSVEKGVL
jgi:hypothetical protein